MNKSRDFGAAAARKLPAPVPHQMDGISCGLGYRFRVLGDVIARRWKERNSQHLETSNQGGASPLLTVPSHVCAVFEAA
jgi:hypothetical protein